MTLTLVTCNTRHFEAVRVTLLNPWAAARSRHRSGRFCRRIAVRWRIRIAHRLWLRIVGRRLHRVMVRCGWRIAHRRRDWIRERLRRILLRRGLRRIWHASSLLMPTTPPALAEFLFAYCRDRTADFAQPKMKAGPCRNTIPQSCFLHRAGATIARHRMRGALRHAWTRRASYECLMWGTAIKLWS